MILKKRYKILKSLNDETFVCLDLKKNIRSFHCFSWIESIEMIMLPECDLELRNNYSWNNKNKYELLYEFNSIEEFKEDYPEYFI